MSGAELDTDGTDTYHPEHPWEQCGHEPYVHPDEGARRNWPPVADAQPHGPAERQRWVRLPWKRSRPNLR